MISHAQNQNDLTYSQVKINPYIKLMQKETYFP